MKIAVVGLGKMGLPFAVQCASKGHKVVGCDVNTDVVSFVNQGKEPFPGEKDLNEKLKTVVSAGHLTASLNTSEAVRASQAVVVLVPVYVDRQGEPDFGWIDAATAAIGAGLKKGTVVSYETTLPVGTTRNRFARALERISGLSVGEDFFVAFSPERVNSGRVFQDLRRYPKLVGGVTPSCESKAVNFYQEVLDFDSRPDLKKPNGVWPMGSSEASELAKLAETTYRDVNIGLANQFAKHADQLGIDIYEVIEGCNSQPFSHIHQPGIAVGGHCIPIYPQMYLLGDKNATIVRSAREQNAVMPKYAVQIAAEALGTVEGLHVAILGLAYRGNVKEHAFSGAFDLVDEFRAKGARVSVHDPLYNEAELKELGLAAYKLGQPADIVVLQANHEEYASLRAQDFPDLSAIVDGRAFLNREDFPEVPFIQIGHRFA